MGLEDLLSLLTTIPAKGSREGAARWFFAVPVIGLLEGLLVSAVGIALKAWPLVSSSCMLLTHVVLTGGMHLDGTADYADVIGSHKRGKEALMVLKDPRRGSFGVTAVVVALLSRFSALYYLASHPLMVIASYVVGMEGAYVASAIGQVEPYEGMARLIELEARRPINVCLNVVTASLILAAISYVQPAALLTLIGLIVPVIAVADSNRRIGFVNGDVLGFVIEVSEVTALLVSAV